jgi:hypothetical protein
VKPVPQVAKTPRLQGPTGCTLPGSDAYHGLTVPGISTYNGIVNARSILVNHNSLVGFKPKEG